jgi:pimeloyl-ACP methyl ester carboxylesterase
VNLNIKKFTFKSNSGIKISGKNIIFPQKSKKNFKHAYDIIFLHAFPFDSEMYVKNFKENKLIRRLNKISSIKGNIRVFLPDMPGFGESELLKSKPTDLLPYVEWVDEIINHFQINHLILGGCSMGGYITLEYVRNNPNIIEGLVLIATKPYADNEEQMKNRLDTINLIEQSLELYSENEKYDMKIRKLYEQNNKLKSFINDLYSRIISQKTRKKNPNLAKEILNLMTKQRALGIIHALNGMTGRMDTTSVLKNLKVKSLIMVGEKDIITPIKIAQQMKKITPKATLEIISSAGHLSNIENLFEFNKKLLEWL